MNKDDILKKSREENQNGDEREEKIRLRSYATSACVGALLCAVFGVVETVLFDRSAPLLCLVYTGMAFSKCLLDAAKLKKRFDIVLSVLLGLTFVAYCVVYITDNVG